VDVVTPDSVVVRSQIPRQARDELILAVATPHQDEKLREYQRTVFMVGVNKGNDKELPRHQLNLEILLDKFNGLLRLLLIDANAWHIQLGSDVRHSLPEPPGGGYLATLDSLHVLIDIQPTSPRRHPNQPRSLQPSIPVPLAAPASVCLP